MTIDVAGFGVSTEDMQKQFEDTVQRFLDKQGWSKNMLADYGLTIHPASDLDNGLRAWHHKYSTSIQGHTYVNIAFTTLDGQPLWCQPPRVGVPIPFRRVRLLDYKRKDGKYRQYASSGNRLYLPQDMSRPDYWVDIAKNPGEPIVITEGEFDAITAHSRGFPCIAVTGIDCFRDKKTGKIAAPGDEFVWEGREVLLIPDQDEESTVEEPIKQSVFQGLERLATVLISAGAVVKVTRIALTTLGRRELGRKVGLSEYFAKGGNPDELWSTAVPVSEMDMKLAKMLQRYSMFEGDVLDNETGKVYRMNNFKNMVSNQIVRVGDKPRPVQQMWMVSPLRITITEFVSRDDVPYGPISDTTFFNTWRGWPISPRPLDGEAAQQTIDYFEDWSRRMWGEEWPWVRGLIAHLLQDPTTLRPHSLVLCTPLKGVGKSTWFRLLGHLVGSSCYAPIDQETFLGRFNDFLRGKMVVHIDEANIFAHSAMRKLTDRISNPVINIESKGLSVHDEPWRGLICMTTNEAFAVKTDKQERRYMQATPDIAESEVEEWRGVLSEVIVPWLFAEEEGADLEERMGYIMAYLLNPEWLDDYDIWQPAPKTSSFLDSIEASKSERTVLAEGLFELLPEVFVFPPGYVPRAANTDGRLDKYILDECCGMAKLKAFVKMRINGKQRTVPVYGKHKDSFVYELKSRQRWVSIDNVLVSEGEGFDMRTHKKMNLSDWAEQRKQETNKAVTTHLTKSGWE